jgi:hypothetical protein
MKLIIRGTEYPATDFRSAAILPLIELQQQAKRVDPESGIPLIEGGLGMSALARMERDLAGYRGARQAWIDGGEVGDEPDLPDAAMILWGTAIFLTLRAAGERITLREALSIPQGDIEQVFEDADQQGDPGEAPDPTTPGDGPVTPDAAGPDLAA